MNIAIKALTFYVFISVLLAEGARTYATTIKRTWMKYALNVFARLLDVFYIGTGIYLIFKFFEKTN